eukprot:1058018-Pelagomonas_calceolata.AAC.3
MLQHVAVAFCWAGWRQGALQAPSNVFTVRPSPFAQGGIDAFFKYDGPLGCWWDESKGTHTVAGARNAGVSGKHASEFFGG